MLWCSCRLHGISTGTMEQTNAIITHRIDIAPGVWIIHVAPDGWELPDFEAGQYAALGLPGTAPLCSDVKRDSDAFSSSDELIKREYSIVSSPKEVGYLEFYLVLVPDGDLSPRLFCKREGGRIWLDETIGGSFTPSRAPDDSNLVMVATGTGIAPYVSMLRTILTQDEPRWISLLHGVRHSIDLGYREELMSMERLCDRFSYFPIVSRPSDEVVPWSGRTGYVQDLWTDSVIERAWGSSPTPRDTHVYLCGGDAMIDAMLDLLGRDGYEEHTKESPGQIHTERYT